jgi:transcriptional regulator with XRE-family HTH domain
MAKLKKARVQSGKSKVLSKQQQNATQGIPSPVDIHVGSRVRLQRTLLGLSQEKLGEAVGLTFQQIQKYERGANRIGASRLHEFSQILDVPVSFFFDGLDKLSAKLPSLKHRLNGKNPDQEDFLQKRETLELVRAYYQIPDTLVRKRLFETIKALAKSTALKA